MDPNVNRCLDIKFQRFNDYFLRRQCDQGSKGRTNNKLISLRLSKSQFPYSARPVSSGATDTAALGKRPLFASNSACGGAEVGSSGISFPKRSEEHTSELQ